MKKLLTDVYTKQGGLEIPLDVVNDLDAIKKHTQISEAACLFYVGDCRRKALKLFKENQNRNST